MAFYLVLPEQATMDAVTFTELLGQEKASAILRANDQRKAALAMEAAIRGGFSIIEFTLTTPGVYELIQDFSRRDGVVVGAGTVLDEEQARKAVEAGAVYLVSPVMDEAVIRAATDLGVASMPGTHTATEMFQAHRAGAELCKLFPAPANGPDYVKSILAPLPFLKIVPTNGVDHLNAGAWLAAGAFGVGFVATLFEPGFINDSRWDDIEERARLCVEACQST
jgi:2-dehydro-3-deoxyphosphogluconate aldolase/(4S)-4-hydroxy-2-oxoglutarate aldolase